MYILFIHFWNTKNLNKFNNICTGPAKKFWMTKIQRSCGQKNEISNRSTETTTINKEDNLKDLYDEKRKLEVINEPVLLKLQVCIQVVKLLKYISLFLHCDILTFRKNC